MRTICLFFFLLAMSHCLAGIMRGAGKATVPMFTMLASWCVLRVTYISIALKFFNKLTTVSWAYPLTWLVSSTILLIYYWKADWIHAFDRAEEKAKQRGEIQV
jgi:Na+-driven multidrug efflux pump